MGDGNMSIDTCHNQATHLRFVHFIICTFKKYRKVHLDYKNKSYAMTKCSI